MSVILAGTGHRPDKLGGYAPKAKGLLVQCATAALIRLKPDIVITGMALGWDLALAQASADLGIPYWAYIPFRGQEGKWPESSQDEYRMLLAMASRIKECCEPGYAAYKMQVRNKMMMDDAHQILALWNRIKEPGSGTWNALKYVEEKAPKPVWNEWDNWQALAKGVLF